MALVTTFPIHYFLLIIAAFKQCSSFLITGQSSSIESSRWVHQMTLLRNNRSVHQKCEARPKVTRSTKKSLYFSGRHSFTTVSGISSSNNMPTDSNKADGILLCINFSISEDTSSSSSTAAVDILMEELRSHVRSVPYAAILPVQPMQYLPSDSGVTIRFLRKKTHEKGMEDGGIQIDIVRSTNDGDDELIDDDYSSSSTNCCVQLTAMRVTDGQTVSKMFSEKIVALKLLEGIRSWVTTQQTQHQRGIQLVSVFHKWMDLIAK